MTKSSKRASRAPKSRVANRRATKGRATQRKTGPNRKSTELKLAELKRRLLEISDLEAAESLLGWDHATYMPEGGAVARARQGATLSRLAHEKSVDPTLGRLLDELQPYADGLASDSDDAGLLRVARRDFEKAIRVPPEFVARDNANGSASYDAWTRARPANDFAAMLPYLEKALELSREYAGFFAPYQHIADPLIDAAAWRIIIDGEPSFDAEFEVGFRPDEDSSDQGLLATGMRAVNAIPWVCDAEPGIVDALHLPLTSPLGALHPHRDGVPAF